MLDKFADIQMLDVRFPTTDGRILIGADGNTVCAACGIPMVEAPSERDSYFEVIMRLGRPGPATWPAVVGKLVS